MYTVSPKKMLIINILDIFRKYTDENHRLSQKQISDILKNEYSMTVDRKSIKRNIQNLIDFGYSIEFNKDNTRMILNTDTGELEESYVMTDLYLERDFTDGELRLLMDGLLSSTYVPAKQCKELIEKVKNLSNIYFKSNVQHITRMQEGGAYNKEIFLNIELIDEAISKNRKISFKYTEYKTDKKIHIKKDADGNTREYIITPYQMAIKDGKYYLICNYDKYDDISNYRIDRICDIKILDEPGKPFNKLKWSNGGRLDLAKYMKEHLYMFASDNASVKFRIPNAMISDVIDMFGMDISFSNEDETGVTVSAFTNEMSMVQFAKSYAPDVIILESRKLREKVKKDLEKSLILYK